MTILEIIKTTVSVAITLFVMWSLCIVIAAFVPAFIKALSAKQKEIREQKKELED